MSNAYVPFSEVFYSTSGQAENDRLPTSVPPGPRIERQENTLIVMGDAKNNVLEYQFDDQGFLSLNLDGTEYSSNPNSNLFTLTLLGITTDTVQGIQFYGGAGDDRLIVGDQILNHALRIQGDEWVEIDGHIVATALEVLAGNIRFIGSFEGESLTLQSENQSLIQGAIRAVDGDGGGTVQILGDQVILTGASIDASGRLGGGTVLVGGDYQGLGTVPTATVTVVDADSSIAADALQSGDGGKVIVWSDGTTQVGGQLSVRGGVQSGNGGFVETSGLQDLQLATTPDISAPMGRGGEWFIDPYNITIVGGSTNRNITSSSATFISTGHGSELGVNQITGALTNGATVLVRTSSGGTEAGNITLNTDLTVNNTGSVFLSFLRLNAHNDIIFNGQTRVFGSGLSTSLALFLQADSDNNGFGGH